MSEQVEKGRKLEPQSHIDLLNSIKGEFGWERRLFIRVMLARNLKWLLKETRKYSKDLVLYTGTAKQTIINACSIDFKKDNFLEELYKVFKRNDFVLTLCWYLDRFIDRFNNLDTRDTIMKQLMKRTFVDDSTCANFLKKNGLTDKQINVFKAALYQPSDGSIHKCHGTTVTEEGNQAYKIPSLSDCTDIGCTVGKRTFFYFWIQSFENLNTRLAEQLQGRHLNYDNRFGYNSNKDVPEGFIFDFNTVNRVFFDLDFLSLVDLRDDIFMYPLLQCMKDQLKNNKIKILFSVEQLEQLYRKFKEKRNGWEINLAKVRTYAKPLGKNENIIEDLSHFFDEAQFEMLYLAFYSKILRNLAILKKMRLLTLVGEEVEKADFELLLAEQFADANYTGQAELMLTALIKGCKNKLSRANVNLDLTTTTAFLEHLDETKFNPYYIFTIKRSQWNKACSFGSTSPDISTQWQNYKVNDLWLGKENTYDLLFPADNNKMKIDKDVHVFMLQPNYAAYHPLGGKVLAYKNNKLDHDDNVDSNGYSWCSNAMLADLRTDYTDKMPKELFYFRENIIDENNGGAAVLEDLELGKEVKDFMRQLPTGYCGIARCRNILSSSVYLLPNGKTIDEETAEQLVEIIRHVLQRAGQKV